MRRVAGGTKVLSGELPEQLIDDEFGCGVDVVSELSCADELVEVVAEAEVGEFGSKVLFGERCCVLVGSVRGEALDDVGRWNSELGQREPKVEQVAAFDRWNSARILVATSSAMAKVCTSPLPWYHWLSTVYGTRTSSRAGERS